MSGSHVQSLIERYPTLSVCESDLLRAFGVCETCFANGRRLLVCGNGGSAADAEHIVGELMKGFLKRRRIPTQFRESLAAVDPEASAHIAEHLQGALPAVSLCGHPALSSAFANDVAPDMVFAQQVYGYGQPGDVLLSLSTSGDSRNVVNAVLVARAKGLRTISLTGQRGGKLAHLCDITVRAPAADTAGVQELHLPMYHWLCAELERRFF